MGLRAAGAERAAAAVPELAPSTVRRPLIHRRPEEFPGPKPEVRIPEPSPSPQAFDGDDERDDLDRE